MNVTMISRLALILSHVKKDPGLSDRVTATTNLLTDIGLDSLELTEFILRVEEETQLVIDFHRLERSAMHSVQSFADFLQTCSRS